MGRGGRAALRRRRHVSQTFRTQKFDSTLLFVYENPRNRTGRAEAFDEPRQAWFRLRRSRSRFLHRGDGDPSGCTCFVAIGEYQAGSSSRWSSSPWARRRSRSFPGDRRAGRKRRAVMPRKFSSKRPLTDAPEAEIQRMIASDPDNPELTDTQIGEARPFAEAFPTPADSVKRGPGRPKLDRRLTVTLRLDPTVVEHFRAQGVDWRKRMAQVLAKAASDRRQVAGGRPFDWPIV